ncbi:Type 1 glutamine amidotransferase-like domain-containing protein [Bdellovibrio sp. HCB209]|uniref:Type 1 glutamine amidotransferase-like domain-containing protein n=1 Tax=Bdellovibrio sp. HCB209 TaxID=3394354 RepID=UPI0039B52B94
MKKAFVISMLTLASLTSSQSFAGGGQIGSAGKPRLILFGNEQSKPQFLPEEALSLFAESSAKKKPLLIIGWQPEFLKNDSTIRAWSGVASHINQREVKHANKAPTTPAETAELVKSIGEAGGILIAGEYSEVLMEGLKDPSIKEALKSAYAKGTLIAGMGAGAQVMGTTVIAEQKTEDIRKKKVTTMEGLGLLNVAGKNTIIEDNFNTRRDQATRSADTPMEYGYSKPRLLLGMEATTNAVGIAIDSGTALIVHDGANFKVMTDKRLPRAVRIYSTSDKSQLNMVSQLGGYLFGEPSLIVGDNQSLKVSAQILSAPVCAKVFN